MQRGKKEEKAICPSLSSFEGITDAKALLTFFETHFPDSIPLIGREALVEDYFKVKPSPLICVKVT